MLEAAVGVLILTLALGGFFAALRGQLQLGAASDQRYAFSAAAGNLLRELGVSKRLAAGRFAYEKTEPPLEVQIARSGEATARSVLYRIEIESAGMRLVTYRRASDGP